MSIGRRGTAVRDRDRRTIAHTQPPCHICEQAIDYSLPYLHPLSFVVDHVIPINRGGIDHIDNKAAAHRSCNRAKSDKVDAPIAVPLQPLSTTRYW